MNREKSWSRNTLVPMPPASISGPGALFLRLVELLLSWTQYRRERRQLLSLSDDTLKDIGITRATAERAANRSFWARVPFRR